MPLRVVMLLLLLFLGGCGAAASATQGVPVATPIPPTIAPTVGLGETTDVSIASAPVSLPTATPVPGMRHGVVLEGLYQSSFEYSGFVPCDAAASAYPERAERTAWLDAAPDSGFYEQYAALNDEHAYAGKSVYARVVADVWPTAGASQGYGHLNGFQNQLTVTQLIAMSLENQCPGA
ncbi:MAG TPA: hypothetical protein VD886_10705 [Herpetosiphonaceae bacterium]|nr:hypothetical protein [Herpetosiphonaceae bacterium]